MENLQNSGHFRPGQSGNPAGKPKGTQSKLTTSAKAAFAAAFEKIGGAENLAAWAQDNQTDFYKLFARMIPVEMTGEGGGPVECSIRVIRGRSDSGIPAEAA